MEAVMYSLTMKRGKRSVFIGLFPSTYRVAVVECNLEWGSDWKPIVEQQVAFFEKKAIKETSYSDSEDSPG